MKYGAKKPYGSYSRPGSPMLNIIKHILLMGYTCSSRRGGGGNKFKRILFGEQCLPSLIGVQEYIVNMTVGQNIKLL